LVELLIAMTILVTITGSTMLMFRGITQAWRSGQLRTERYQQARLVFDLFARELSSCISHARYPLVGNDAEGTRFSEDSTQDEVFFVGAFAGRAGLVERGYWVNRDGALMCHDDEPADGDYETTGTDEVCGTDVVGFEVSYFDGAQWLPQWDGRAGGDQAARVPKAIRLTLTIGEKHPEAFDTIVHVPTS
jgi:type II secretory pathway pseudopilin PulG